MNPESKAKELGIQFKDDAEIGYLNMVVSSGNMLITSGHVAKIKGKLGDDLNVDQGYIAAKAVWHMDFTIYPPKGWKSQKHQSLKTFWYG